MPLEEAELEEEEEERDEEEIETPKISEVVGDPIKIVAYVYDSFKIQKKKEELKVLRDIAMARENWDKLSNDPAYKGLMSVRMANALIELIDKAYWISNFRADKADRAMEDIRTILPEYYIMKSDEQLFSPEEAKGKEVILKIEKKDEDMGKEFIKKAKEELSNYMEDEATRIIFQESVVSILKKERYDKNFIATMLRRVPGRLNTLKLPEELNKKVFENFVKVYELYNSLYGFYPFSWGEYKNYRTKRESEVTEQTN